MVNWDDLKTILALVRGGSLAAAASELGVSYTTIARRISRAEAALDQTLFHRLADGYTPTEAGLLAAAHAAEMAEHQDTLLRQFSARDARLAGPLTVTAPQLVIAHLLAPVLSDFVAAYPDIDLQVRATNEILDLTRREADLAIRISNDPGDTLKGQRVTAQHTASFATPDWADRIEADPDGPIDWIAYTPHKTLPETVTASYPGARIRYRFDDMVAMVGAARQGLGVVRLPLFLGRDEGDLVQVPCLPPQPYMDIWVVGHADVWPATRPAAFRAILRQHLPRLRAACTA